MRARTIPRRCAAMMVGLACVMGASVAHAWPDWIPRWDASGRAVDAHFGRACWGAGDVDGDGFDDILVADEADAGPLRQGGHVMLYAGSATGPGRTPAWEISGESFGWHLGESVRGAGDVNRDGFDDVAVTAPWWSNGENGEGRVLVFHGSATGLPATPSWTFETDVAFAEISLAVPAGDVNGDGFDDLLVTAPGIQSDTSPPGRAFVFLGSSGGLAATPAWTLVGSTSADHVGFAATGGGDVDRDGFDDIVIGTWTESPYAVHAVLYLGSPTGPTPTTWTLPVDRYHPIELAFAGDVDGDGHDDLIVGEIDYYATDSDARGRMRVFRGNGAGLEDTAAFTRRSEDYLTGPPEYWEPDDTYGRFVAPAGDQDGDGRADILVGAPTWGRRASGRAHLYSADRGSSWIEPWTAAGMQAGEHSSVDGTCCPRSFGRVAPAGDVNGDGIPDLLVGAHGEDDAGRIEHAGRAYVYFGADARPLEPSDARYAVRRLEVARSGAALRLTWEDAWYFPLFNVHQGSIASLHAGAHDHAPVVCRSEPAEETFPIPPGGVYFLVSSMTHRGAESVVGRDSFGVESPPPSSACP